MKTTLSVRLVGRRLGGAAAALLLTLAFSGCGADKPEELVASAKVYLAKNDSKAAVIQLKNALQANPDFAEARFLLGAAFLDSGNPTAAEVELRKARTLKFPDEQVVPKLAEALLYTGQDRKVVEEFSKTELTGARAKAELKLALASAYSVRGQTDLATAALDASLAADPAYEPALLGRARQLAGRRDFDGAMAATEAILAKSPQNFEALKLKGDLQLFARNQPSEALETYRLSVVAKPEFLAGHSAIASLLLQQNSLEPAAKQVAEMKKFAARNPQTIYLDGQLAYQKKDFKAARELSQQLLRIAPDNPNALQLAGAAEFQLNSLVQAEVHLSKAVQTAPQFSLARRLLVATYMRSGQLPKALTALQPGLATTTPDPAMYSLAGEVYLQSGELTKAEDYFAKASKLDPTDARKRTSLAVTQMMAGRVDAAFGELEDISASDKGVSADLALISAHLSRREYDKALKAIDVLEQKQPDKPLAGNLRGRTLQASGDMAAARASFERALALAPSYYPTVASLAALDMADKKPEEARKRFEAFLALQPNQPQALLALADLSARSGASKETVAEQISKAVAASPTDATARLLLVDFYLRNKDVKSAMSAAQAGVASLPDSAEMLAALGRVQRAAGELNQAIATLTKVAAMQPMSPVPQLLLAELHIAEKNTVAAQQSLRKALEVKPDSVEAQRGLILIALSAQKFADAATIAREVQKQRPKEPVGYALEGDIAVAKRDWTAAATAYGSGLLQGPSGELALKLHSVKLAAGKAAEADKIATDWMKSHPGDAAFLSYLGDSAIARKDYALAERHYVAVLKINDKNPVALNNLAWVSGRLNKLDAAIGYVEKAMTLAPNQPAFMDTLAGLLSDKGDHTKAIEWQAKALKSVPDNWLFKLNLAKIYIKSGDKAQAKVELDALTAMGDKISAQEEVAKLSKELGA